MTGLPLRFRLQEFHRNLVTMTFQALNVDESQLDERKRSLVALQIKLPKKLGGLGIYNTADFVDAHRLATLMAALPLAAERLESEVIYLSRDAGDCEAP